jgi:ATP-binding cassette subfamily B protein
MAISVSRKTLNVYVKHTLNHKRDLWRTILGVPIAQLAEDFVVPFLVSRILTELAVSQGAGHSLQFASFGPYLWGIVAAEIFQMFTWNFVVRGVWRMEESTMQDLAMTSFKHLSTMSQRFFNNRFGGSIVSQVNKFIGSYERLADTVIWNVYKLAVSFVFTVAILVGPAPLYVLGLVVFATVYIIAVYKVKQSELPFNQEWAALETKRTGQLADSITNIAAVKSFAHEELETSLFAQRVQAVKDKSLATMRLHMLHELSTNSVQRLLNLSAIVVSIWLAVHGNIKVGIIYLILTYTLSIMGRLWQLNQTFRNLNRVFGDARDMTEMLEIEPEVKDPEQPEKSAIHRGRIEFKDADFRHHDGGAQIFKKLNLHITPGEKIGLVGPSGSGKTTLTQLLLRLIDIQKGEILIDNQNISSITQKDLRSSIAYVPQEPLMFHRSIMDNIRYGQLDASDKQVVAAAKMANAHEFIKTLKDGYDTLVGERGTKLSGGQRQRVAIARAMLKNAPILVLDEATSALDSESEVLIQDALWKLMEGRTAIVIAHRLSTIQKMDRILVLEKGTIVEQGSHRELLTRRGLYAKLWTHQSGGFIED